MWINKQLTIAIVAFVFTLNFSYSQCERSYLLNSQPTLHILNSTYFVNENVGYVVGNSGTVLKTEDAGSSWTSLNVEGAWESLIDLHFFDENTGIALASSSSVFKTDDGGHTWEKNTITSNSQLSFEFITEATGYLAADTKIYKTETGGDDWGELYDFSENIKELKVVENNVLMVSTDVAVYKSEDLGESWSEIYQWIEFSYKKYINFWSAAQWGSLELNTNDYNFYFHRTSDNGNNWDVINLGLNTDPNSYIKYNFINENLGFIMVGDDTNGSLSKLLKTVDGGYNWVEVNMEPGTWNRWNNEVTFINGTTGIMVGSFGSIQRTTDSGDNWISVTDNNTFFFTQCEFINDQVGLVVGEQGKIFRSEDGGSTWNGVDSKTTKWFNNVHSLNDSFTYAVSGSVNQNDLNSDIVFSTDLGETWNVSYTSADNILLQDAHFVDELNGIAIGSSGTILNSSDGGNTWQTVFSGTTKGLKFINFVSSTVGFISGDEILLKTSNAGSSWSIVNSTDLGEVYSMQFIDENKGYLGSSYGIIYVTSDGGTSYSQLSINSNPEIFSINFLDNNTGYISTTSNVQKTTDGGNTWTTIDFDTDHELRDIEFINSTKAIVVGRGGAIFSFNTVEPIEIFTVEGELTTCIGEQVFHTQLMDNMWFNWSVSEGGEVISEESNSATINWTSTGTHTVIMYPQNSCGIGASIEYDVEVNSPPYDVLELIGGATESCLTEQTYEVNSISNVEYSWQLTSDGGVIQSQNSNQVIVLWSATGIQTLEVSISNEQCGIGTIQSFEISTIDVPEVPLIDFGSNVLTSSSTEGNQWYSNDQPIAGAVEEMYTISDDGIYYIGVTNTCGTTISEKVDLIFTEITSRIDGEVVMYPNPASEFINIRTPKGEIIRKINIYNIKGYEVTVDSIHDEKSFISLQNSNLSPGVYLLKLETDKHQYNSRLIIE